MAKIQCISPVDGSVYLERETADAERTQAALTTAAAAQAGWKRLSVAERAALCARAVDHFVAHRDDIAAEITWQMGRPISQSPGEVGGFEERARYMIEIADGALADLTPAEKSGFRRFIRREPVGVVFVIAPWNYPYLTSVNAIIPALLAGNTVLLKHSAQTPLCAERLQQAFDEAGLPPGVFQHLHLTHADTERVIQSPEVDFVAFTGSVPGGAMVERAAVGRFIGVGLELGGKDPAYVRADADVEATAEGLVDGAFFNSGQSCCGIQRIYVHEKLYDDFVAGAVGLTSQYVLGDPTLPETTLGPVVRSSAADQIRRQVEASIAAGAQPTIDEKRFARSVAGTPYLAPQLLVGVDHGMTVMREEIFGPVAGVMKVSGDEEAIRLMNDSDFGLTASVWTADEGAALSIGDRIQTGTWFMNRCDYLDPALAWVGVKDSGRGCTLSRVGYEHLTRPKSFHLRVRT